MRSSPCVEFCTNQPRGRLLRMCLVMTLLAAGLAPAVTTGGQEGIPQSTGELIENIWEITCVDCPHGFEDLTDRGLRMDVNDHPHIAYGGDNLYYASFEDGAWQVEIADPSPQVGQHAALDFDADGYPHISYYDAANDALKYAHKDAMGWHVEQVDAGLYPYAPTSLALHEGIPTISYSAPDALKVARRDSTGWITETVESVSRSVSSLALDADGNPHVAYVTHFAAGLRYAYKDGDGWQVQVVTSAASSSAGVSLALDSDNRPHLSYAGGSTGLEMRYAFHDGVTWQFETIDPISAGGNISLALRADGTPIASYVQEVEDHWGDIEYAVRYAVRAASGWEATTIAGFTIWHGGWGSTSLALTAAGTPLIAFTDPSQGLLLVLDPVSGLLGTVDAERERWRAALSGRR